MNFFEQFVVQPLTGIFEKKRWNARDFLRAFISPVRSVLQTWQKTQKMRQVLSALKKIFCLGVADFSWVTS